MNEVSLQELFPNGLNRYETAKNNVQSWPSKLMGKVIWKGACPSHMGIEIMTSF